MSQNKQQQAKTTSPSKMVYITFFALAMMNVANVGTGNPVQLAFFGLSGITFYAVAAILFFLPTGLVAAELAGGWPERGGIFRWVGEGLGKGWGFLCLCVLWFNFVVNYGSGIPSNAATIGFFTPFYDWAVHFAEHPKYLFFIMLGWIAYYWFMTYLGTRGVKFLSVLTKYGIIIGMIIPLCIQIILLIVWFFQGNHSAVSFAPSGLIPKWNGFSTLSMAAIVLFSFAGIDENAGYIKKLRHPRKEFPKAMFISMILCFTLMCFGLLVYEMLIPVKDLNLLFSGYTLWRTLGSTIHIPWLYVVFSWFGLISSFASSLVGMSVPSYMLAQVGQTGFLPKKLHTMNDKGVPARLMYFSTACMTVIALLVFFIPGVEGFSELAVQAITVIYLLYYILMFISFIRLRYTQPNRPRSFKIPGGNVVAWIITIVGVISCIFGIFIAFFPPTQLKKVVGSGVAYVIILSLLVAFVILFAFGFYRFSRKRNWVDPNNEFAPFTWEIEGMKKPGKSLSNIPTDMLSANQNGMGLPIKKTYDPNTQITLPPEYQYDEKHKNKEQASTTLADHANATSTSTHSTNIQSTPSSASEKKTEDQKTDTITKVLSEQKQVDTDIQKLTKEEEQTDQDIQKLNSQAEENNSNTSDTSKNNESPSNK